MPETGIRALFAELTGIFKDAAAAAAEGQNALIGPGETGHLTARLDQCLTDASAVLARIRAQS